MVLPFAVLHHQLPIYSSRLSHWDLLMASPQPESKQLICFELAEPPDRWTALSHARRLPDHKTIYLTYEGPVSNDRGEVSRVLDGLLEWVGFDSHSFEVLLRPHSHWEGAKPLRIRMWQDRDHTDDMWKVDVSHVTELGGLSDTDILG
jgi:hypothetical protein